ncbi:helix-hairpin-helix domain-containing protein [Streptomyces sp. NPDC088554]|uniref:helix-hairpin-helix domain-containing protein n=1 Tax=Streptomyces sp. NPDC088554 TaxID=3365865 RepID=UPI00381C73F9
MPSASSAASGSSGPSGSPRQRADALFAAASVDRTGAAGTAGASLEAPAVAETGGREAEGGAAGGAGKVAALRDRLPLWVQLRCGLEPRTLAALAVVLVVAAVLAAQHFWTARPRSVGAPETISAGVPVAEAPPGGVPETGSAGAKPPPAAGAARVVVDVGGKVRRPGVLRLPSGSRVADALEAAGGAEPGAELTGLNRARVLLDGEQLLVDVAPPPGGETAGGGAVSGAGGAGAGAAPVSLNTATLEQFDTLPGVGPVLARRILDYRTRNGGFRSVDELREVSGIGERRFADLQPLVSP